MFTYFHNLAIYKIISRFILLSLVCISPQLAFADEKPAIKFGVLSIAQPSRIFDKWQPFANYMSEALNQPVEIIVPRGFGKMKKAITKGEVDFFYINSHVFYRLTQKDIAVAVAQMKNIAGGITSRSEVFVKRDSGIKKVMDLKGKSIAYVSPMGAGGYVAPRASLNQSGLNSGVDSKEVFTKNLSNSIHGVLLGDYDAGTMCGVNYKLMSQKIKTGDLIVINVSEPYPENVIGARASLSKNVIERFKEIVLNMPKNPKGVALLAEMKSMKIQSFVKYDKKSEALTKSLLKISRI